MSEHTNNSHFVHRSYGLKELATLYFPNIAPASALDHDNPCTPEQAYTGKLPPERTHPLSAAS